MAKWYVKSNATGNEDGTTEADAWVNSTQITGTSTGDQILLYAVSDEVLTTAFIPPTGAIGARLDITGVSATGVNDGTRYVFDGNSASARGIQLSNTTVSITFSNIEIKNCTSDGVESSSSSNLGCAFNNCYSHDNGGLGFKATRMTNSEFVNCIAKDNTGDGFDSREKTLFMGCKAIGNGVYGFDGHSSGSVIHYNCMAIDNGTDGYQALQGHVYINCIADNNTSDGWFVNAVGCHLVECKATNNGAYGLNLVSMAFLNGVYIPAGGEDGANTTAPTTGNFEDYTLAGHKTADLAGTDTDAGYVNSAADNFIASLSSLFLLRVSTPFACISLAFSVSI